MEEKSKDRQGKIIHKKGNIRDATKRIYWIRNTDFVAIKL